MACIVGQSGHTGCKRFVLYSKCLPFVGISYGLCNVAKVNSLLLCIVTCTIKPVCTWFSSFYQQSPLFRYSWFCISWGWSGINQYKQDHPEKKMLLSKPKYSDSPNPLASCLISFKVSNDILISNENSLECYWLLLTPQCDKPCCLLTGWGHTWVILFFQSSFYSIINCAYIALLQKKTQQK